MRPPNDGIHAVRGLSRPAPAAASRVVPRLLMSAALCQAIAAPFLVNRLTVPFQVDGTLVKVAQFATRPLLWELRLRSALGDGTIHSFADLRGHVHIRTPAEALSFVRLRSSPATYGLLAESGVLEVIPRSQAGDSLVFKDRATVKLARADPPGAYGVVTDRWWERSRLPAAVARELNGGFVVARATMSIKGFGRRLRIATERVGKDGSYAVEFGRDMDLPPGLSRADVWLPMEM